MPAFHQMGHQCENLLSCENLNQFCGAILSPVNYNQEEIKQQIDNYGISGFEMIFDPQMYYPLSQKGKLQSWSYMPNDYYTADMTSDSWWDQIISRLVEKILEISPDSVCTPIPVPRVFPNEYYVAMTRLANTVYKKLQSENISVLQTIIVNIAELSNFRRVHEIASIVTTSGIQRAYIIFYNQTTPRQELRNVDELEGAMLFINLLEKAGMRVLIGYCSSDIILWKEAGATNCATGKFFNLRRFTPSRWDDEEGGRGQLPYWFEEGLLAYLRESDISRIQRGEIISEASKKNPYSGSIQQKMTSGNPWVGLGWRQYLYWFANVEQRFSTGEVNADMLLLKAEGNWKIINELRDPIVLMEEERNNGDWIRPWRRAVNEFRYI